MQAELIYKALGTTPVKESKKRKTEEVGVVLDGNLDDLIIQTVQKLKKKDTS